jgi:hypothetical protein
MATEVSADFKRHVSCLIVALQFYPQMAIKMIHDFPPNMVLFLILSTSSPWFIFVGNGFFPQFSEGAWTKLKRRISLHKSDRSNLLNPSVQL